MIYNLTDGHSHSTNNRDEISNSKVCGCFFCLKIFSPEKIVDWVDESNNSENSTAICPFCSVDSVIGDESGFPICKEFLSEMYLKWFEE